MRTAGPRSPSLRVCPSSNIVLRWLDDGEVVDCRPYDADGSRVDGDGMLPFDHGGLEVGGPGPYLGQGSVEASEWTSGRILGCWSCRNRRSGDSWHHGLLAAGSTF